MERLLILNASPRAPQAHSRIYARMLADAWKGSALCQEVRPGCHSAIRQAIGEADALVLVFPLYADSLPVPLLRLFKELEACPPCRRPAVSVVVNCGFLEPFQNDIAVEMVRLFCRRNGYPFAAALEIASGEAILDTPFRFLAGRALRRLARAIRRGERRVFRVTMPLPKRVFLRASTAYWTAYGRRFGVSPRQMALMEIEPGPPSP